VAQPCAIMRRLMGHSAISNMRFGFMIARERLVRMRAARGRYNGLCNRVAPVSIVRNAKNNHDAWMHAQSMQAERMIAAIARIV
jgi:hypothetical protein